MSISAISGSTAPDYTAQTQSTHRRTPPSLDDTASLLGISTSTLNSDLQSGDTLSSLASSAGVSSSSLLSAVEQDLSSNAPSGSSSLSSSQLSQMATDLINGTPPSGGPGGAGGPSGAGGPTPPSMTNTASLLGISTDTLTSDLQSGDTLSSLASSAGVSSSDLLSAVEQDMSANAPSGAPTLSSDQLTQMATDFIDGVQPGSSSASTTASGDAGYGASGASVSTAQVSGSLYDVFA
ncbi:MAG TPA: LysM peptidoglycan-binding domain-containing protein [Solirubrobacteraceae bacterium]|nr:LysM peptidoglycan-binding domain-containing protein [Solirubrobacteraceae bacterium]